jgi:hypothetical protein
MPRQGPPASCSTQAAATSKERAVPELFVCLRSFLCQPLPGGDRGTTAVEYGLVVA